MGPVLPDGPTGSGLRGHRSLVPTRGTSTHALPPDGHRLQNTSLKRATGKLQRLTERSPDLAPGTTTRLAATNTILLFRSMATFSPSSSLRASPHASHRILWSNLQNWRDHHTPSRRSSENAPGMGAPRGGGQRQRQLWVGGGCD